MGAEPSGLRSDCTNDLPSQKQAIANSSMVRLDQCSNSAIGHLPSISLLSSVQIFFIKRKDGQSPL